MEFNLIKIFQSMGGFAVGIAVVLFAMAVISLSVLLERLWVFRRTRVRSQSFAQVARPQMEQHQYEALLQTTQQPNQGYLAQLIGAGLSTFLSVGVIEAVRRQLVRKHEDTAVELRRGLNMLASIGSVAPFVGLLGTVIGIIAAFQGIAKEGTGGLGAVSSGIAEALVMTAFGLFVAIPAVLIFNYLSARADGILHQLEQAEGELVDHLEFSGQSAVAPAAGASMSSNGSADYRLPVIARDGRHQTGASDVGLA